MKPRVGNSDRTLKQWCGLLFGGRLRHILFRVDAGRVPGLSFGHLYRCLSVARVALTGGAVAATFLMRDYPEGVRVVEKAGFDISTMPVGVTPDHEAAQMNRLASDLAADWVVVDIPYLDQDFSWLRGLRADGARILFVDDYRFRVPEADVVWNSGILAPDRVSSDNPKARILAGIDYFLFDGNVNSAPPIRTEGRVNVLISFGGSDPTGLTLRVVEALLTRPWPECLFRVVLGPGFRGGPQVRDTLKCSGEDWVVVESPSALVPYLAGSDVAVSNGGQTLYQLAYLGRTTLPVASTEHEADTVAGFLEHGLIPAGLAKWDRAAFLEGFSDLVQSTEAAH